MDDGEGPEARLTCVLPTVSVTPDVQYSVYRYNSSHLVADVRAVFPDLPPAAPSVLVAITMQRTSVDLVSRAPAAERDKNALGERFVAVARRVRRWMGARAGCWADGADPATGHPLEGARAGGTHSDMETVQRCLRYAGSPVGSCYVLEHPQWGTRCYPGCIFACGDEAALLEALAAAWALETTAWSKAPRTSLASVFIAPPRDEHWHRINGIRERYFDDLRCGPHVSVVDPFVQQLEPACRVLRAHLATVPPFRIRLHRLAALRHNARSCTIYAVPESEPPSALQAVSRALLDVFPMCDDLVARGGGALTAHVSLARAGDERDERRVMELVQQEWQPFEFAVSHVLVLRRDGALGSGQPFALHEAIPLGHGDAVPLPPFGPDSDVERSLNTVVLYAGLSAGGARALRNRQGDRLQSVLELRDASEAAAFVAAHPGQCALLRDVMYP